MRHRGRFQTKIVFAKSGLSFLVKFQCVFVNLELDCVCDRQEFGTLSRLASMEKTMPDDMALIG